MSQAEQRGNGLSARPCNRSDRVCPESYISDPSPFFTRSYLSDTLSVQRKSAPRDHSSSAEVRKPRLGHPRVGIFAHRKLMGDG